MLLQIVHIYFELLFVGILLYFVVVVFTDWRERRAEDARRDAALELTDAYMTFMIENDEYQGITKEEIEKEYKRVLLKVYRL